MLRKFPDLPLYGILLLAIGGLASVIIYLPPPDSFLEADWTQSLGLLGPLLIIFTIIPRLILKTWPRSIVIGFSLIILTTLYLMNSLTLVSGGLLLVATLFIYISLRKKPQTGLPTRIPRMSRLQRQR